MSSLKSEVRSLKNHHRNGLRLAVRGLKLHHHGGLKSGVRSLKPLQCAARRLEASGFRLQTPSQ